MHNLQDVPDAWLQLLQLCIASDICRPKVVAAMEAIQAAGAQKTWHAGIS
jgi:hypothetical protein